MRFPALVLLAAVLAFCRPAGGFIPYATVVEYFNEGTGHYFLTAELSEMQAIDAGSAGPGWRRTGYTLRAYYASIPLGGVPVCRFYAPSQNSHFFTADAAECSFLRTHPTGWNYEGTAFQIDVPVAGACPPAMQPVFRLYNNRFQFNDSNHRFTPDAAERARMLAQGWKDESTAFCALSWGREFEKRFDLYPADVLPSAQCLGEAATDGPCVSLSQLPPMPFFIPRELRPTPDTSAPNPDYPLAADTITGTRGSALFAIHPPGGAEPVAAHSFVQSGGGFGIHLQARDRTAVPFASIDPAYRFRTVSDIVATRPWGDGYDHDLVVSFDLLVKTLRQENPAGHAYGHPMLEFMDRRSALHFYVTLGTYGTPQPQDFVGRHAVTSNVIVSTFFRDVPRFGRRLAGQWIACGDCVPQTSFKFAINRTEFAQVLALARTLEPALSADPVDYRLANFRFQNEAYGDAESGVSITGLKLEIFFAR
jgi:Repeat of unknown function (DUF5648)